MNSRGFTLLELLLVVVILGILAAVGVPFLIRSRIAANEAVALADVRSVIAAQAAYRALNQGFFEGRLECLATPTDNECLPGYPSNSPPFLDASLSKLVDRSGYRRSFTAGPAAQELSAWGSQTSVVSYSYDATPLVVGQTGVRGFAGDGSGRICYTPDGTPVSRHSPSEMDPACEVFE